MILNLTNEELYNAAERERTKSEAMLLSFIKVLTKIRIHIIC